VWLTAAQDTVKKGKGQETTPVLRPKRMLVER
jgi:hypothetical protein